MVTKTIVKIQTLISHSGESNNGIVHSKKFITGRISIKQEHISKVAWRSIMNPVLKRFAGIERIVSKNLKIVIKAFTIDVDSHEDQISGSSIGSTNKASD
jgi:hypothetical protein